MRPGDDNAVKNRPGPLKAECVSWSEQLVHDGGHGELIFTVAEKRSGNWNFFERSTWEVVWYQAGSTPERIAKAELLLHPPQS